MSENSEVSEWLAELDSDLRKHIDRSDSIDELLQISFSGDPESVERASWCLAKMGQNHVSDMRILTILHSLSDDPSPAVRENVAWGIGEMAGAGLGDEISLAVLKKLLADDNRDIRGMSLWAVGRLRSKLGLSSPDIDALAESSLNDESEYVRQSAKFALGR